VAQVFFNGLDALPVTQQTGVKAAFDGPLDTK